MTQPTLGAIRYLNALPLVAGLERNPDLAETRFEIPSLLAAGLRSGELDLALVPQVEACRDPDYRIVPDLCISCKGAVESILLFRRKEWNELETIGVDLSSNSSVELLKVLFHRRTGRVPRCVPVAPYLDRLRDRPGRAPIEGDEPRLDAILLIGDRALAEDRGEYPRDDLGSLWFEQTGLPFVFAVWLGRVGADPRALRAVRQAARSGLAHRTTLVDHFCREQPGLLSPDRALRYVTEVIRYSLGEEEIEAIRSFHAMRRAANLVTEDWTPRFFDESEPAP